MALNRGAINIIAVGMILMLASQVHANIFGADNRRLITPADNLSAVGLIICDGTTRRPTATLIKTSGSDQRIIISVAHAFLSRADKPLGPCTFWPEGKPQDATPIIFAMLGTESPDGTVPDHNWNEDWAVARLARPLPSKYHPLETLTLSVDEANSVRAAGGRFLLAGHNGETGPMMLSDQCGPMVKRDADINRFDDRAFNHDCDMMPGWSGGPLMLIRNGQRYVIAVNATELNALVTRAGEPYNGSYNANTAVRLDGPFLETISRLARLGRLSRPGPGPDTCRVWMPDPITPKRC